MSSNSSSSFSSINNENNQIQTIKKLDSELGSKLVGCYQYSTIWQCLISIVRNSLEANPQSKVDVLFFPEQWSFVVTDDGIGMSFEDLKLCGQFGCTSKSNRRSGQSLFSISKISSSIVIFSRWKNDFQTFQKEITNENNMIEKENNNNNNPPQLSTKQNHQFQRTCGTCVIVNGLFSTVPVRRKRISSIENEISMIRFEMERLAFAFPQVQLSLRLNNASNQPILKTPRLKSLEALISHFWGSEKLNNKTITKFSLNEGGAAEQSPIQIELMLFGDKEGSTSKQHQLFFINKTNIHKSELHRSMEFEWKKAIERRQSYENNNSDSKMKNKIIKKEQHQQGAIASLSTNTHPIYYVNLECSPDQYDIIFETNSNELHFLDKQVWSLLKRQFMIHFKRALSQLLWGSHSNDYYLFEENKEKEVPKIISEKKEFRFVLKERPNSAPPQFKPNSAYQRLKKLEGKSKELKSSEKENQQQQDNKIDLQKYLSSKSSRVDDVDLMTSSVISNSISIPKTMISTNSKSTKIKKEEERKSLTDMFNEWKNPSISSEPLSLLAQSQVRMKTQLKLEKSDLLQVRVVNQVDKKFILTVLGNGKLVVFDQHAIDERIQLEKFEIETYGKNGLESNVHSVDPIIVVLGKDDDDGENGSVSFENETSKKKRKITSNSNNNKKDGLHWTFSEQDFQTIKQNILILRKWGWEFEFKNAVVENLEEHKNAKNLKIISIPQVMGVLLNRISFLTEFLLKLRENATGVNFIRPDSVQRILESKACRSAIKFGDDLSYEECIKLISELSFVRFPFQCAHGRPSVFPLIQM